MLDSMFAMDPVFPGLGLDNLDQPFDMSWGSQGDGMGQNGQGQGMNQDQSDSGMGTGSGGFTFDSSLSNLGGNSFFGSGTGDTNAFDAQPWMSWIDNSSMLDDKPNANGNANGIGNVAGNSGTTLGFGDLINANYGNDNSDIKMDDSSMASLNPLTSDPASGPSISLPMQAQGKSQPESKGPTTIEGFLASTFGAKKSSSEVYKSVVKP
jgi:hypothetical protein